jgi:type III secretion protein U
LGSFLALWIFLGFGIDYFGRHLAYIVERAIQAADPLAGGGELLWLPQMQSMAQDMLWILAPLLCLSAACAVVIGGLQTRGLVSAAALTPKFERINPAQGLQNLFSTRQLFELGKMLIKTALLMGMLAYCLAMSLHPLVQMIYAPAADILRISGTLVWRLMGWAALIYGVGAALDFAHQFHEFMKKQKVSVDEIRREYRDREGDPQIKGRRRAIAREMAFTNRLVSASVVVVNPTHVSVALHYAPGKTALPRVVVKGLDAMALRIRTQAERDGVPVLEDPPLARKLYREVALDHYINEGLIDVVAAAFRWARQVDRRSPQAGSRSPTQKPTPRTV